MEKQNKTAYWIFLRAVILFICVGLCAGLCVGNTRAYYQNTVYWNTIVQPEGNVVSDCLLSEGQTILLGAVTQETVIPITLQTDGEVHGRVTCSLVNAEQGMWLYAAMGSSDVSLKNGTAYVHLILTPTEMAAELVQEQTVDVLVTFEGEGEHLSAIFRATLPGVTLPEFGPGVNGVYAMAPDTGIIEGIVPDEDPDDTKEDSGSTEEDSGSTEEDSGSTEEDSGSTEEDSDSTEEDSGSAEGENPETDSNDPYTIGADTQLVPFDIMYGYEYAPETADPEDRDDTGNSANNVDVIDPDTEIIEGIVPGGEEDNAESEEAGNSANDVYVVDPDTGIIDGIVPGGGTGNPDDPYSTDPDTGIIDGIVPGNPNDPYNTYPDTGIIDGIVPGNPNDPYNTDPDTGIIDGIVPGNPNDPYNADPDTGIIDGIVPGNPNDPYVTDPDTEIKEDIKPEIPILGGFAMNTLVAYSKDAMLPVIMDIPVGSMRLELCLYDGTAEGPFPAFTRYSLDGGNSWFMLYYGGNILLEGEALMAFEMAGECLLLDLSNTAWGSEQIIYFYGKADTEEGRYIGFAVCEPMVSFLDGGEAEDMPILDTNGMLYLPERGAAGERTVTVEKLTVRDNAAVYEKVTDGSIAVNFDINGMVISAGEIKPKAGTYRLTVEYKFAGICFAQTKKTFFVNYSGGTRSGI